MQGVREADKSQHQRRSVAAAWSQNSRRFTDGRSKLFRSSRTKRTKATEYRERARAACNHSWTNRGDCSERQRTFAHTPSWETSSCFHLTPQLRATSSTHI